MKVLCVGSDPEENRRVAAALEGEPGTFHVVTETDPVEAFECLTSRDIDCLVAGNDLPGMDGVAFLESVRETHGDLPFVLFTGSGSEEVASRAISAGVTDYVRKRPEGGGLDELVDRIRALSNDDETATGRAYDEAQFEQFIEAFPDVVFVIDEEGRYVDVIASGKRPLLYDDPEELLGNRFHELFPAETADRFLDAVRNVLEAGEQRRIEYQLEVQSDTRWFEARVGPLDVGGDTQTVFWIVQDVTARKRREQEYEQIFDGVNDIIAIHDPETGEMVDVNRRMCELTGHDEETVLELGIEGLLREHPSQDYAPSETPGIIHRVMSGEDIEPYEQVLETSDGDTVWIEVNPTRAIIGGEERFVAISRDVTERKRREREYQQIFDGVNDAIAIQDPETGEPVDVNETFLDRLGYDDIDGIREEGLSGLSATESGYTKERAQELCRRVMETGESEVVEWKQESKDGERRWVEATIDSAVIQGEDRILSIQRDITERKRRQRIIQKLHASTNNLQEAESIEDVCEATVAAAKEVLNLSMPICWIHGFEEPGVLSPVATTEAAWDAPPGSDGPGEFEPGDFQYEVYETGEMRVYDPSEMREETPLNHGLLIGLGDHGMFGAADPSVEAFDDITLDAARILARHATAALDRVERERELQESERRFRLIAERIDEVIYLANTDFTEVLYVNPAYETIWGRPTDELYDDAQNFIEAIDPRDREKIESEIEAMLAEIQQDDPADSYDFEYRIRQPGGETRWVSATGYAVEMSGDERRFVGIVEDITERKYREQRLEVFNRILRHNLRNQLDVIRSHAEILTDRIDDSHPKRIVAAVDELAMMGARARKTDRIMSMGDDASELSLPETLEEVAEEVTREQGEVKVATDLPASAWLTNNVEALQAAVRSALENAIEYADSEVRLTVEDHPGGYTVIIDDDGPGIPEGELIPIKAGTETNLNHGRGLGLWQLRWGVDKLNGELSFGTNEGTTIRISIPDRADTARRN